MAGNEAPDEHVLVTREMIDAGVRALEWGRDAFGREQAVREVYTAMELARRHPPPPQASPTPHLGLAC